MKKLTFFLLSIVYLLPVLGHAQFDASQFNLSGIVSLSDELTIDVIPTYPKPNSAVQLNLRMYTENLDTAYIIWTTNGSNRKEGRGLTSYNFDTQGAGSTSVVRVSITLATGVSFSKSITIRPAGIDLLWQAHSYTPPFYKGKAHFPSQGSVTVLALPEVYSSGGKVPAERLVYKWTINGEVAESQSGYGKNVLRARGSILGTELEVDVTATDPVSNSTASSYLIINPTDPQIVFYENNPLYGIIFEKSINNGVNMQGEEIYVVAAPYYVNIGDSLDLSWRMNGKLAAGISGLSATFRKPENISGSTYLSLTAENPLNVLQFAEGGFRINYGNE